MTRTLGVILLLGWAASAAYADRTLYVQSPAAKLLSAARMDAPGTPLNRGEAVTQTGEEGMFYQVRSNAGTGFVPKLYLSSFAPGSRVNFGNIDRDTSVKARARASNYSQTASARGLSSSESLRTRGSLSDYDFDGLDWIERLSPSQDEVSEFRARLEKGR